MHWPGQWTRHYPAGAFSPTGKYCPCFSGDTCTPSDLRQYDLYHWKQQAEELLPDATLELEFDAAFSTYSMKLKWDDRYDTDADQAAGDESKEFIYHFQVGAG